MRSRRISAFVAFCSLFSLGPGLSLPAYVIYCSVTITERRQGPFQRDIRSVDDNRPPFGKPSPEKRSPRKLLPKRFQISDFLLSCTIYKDYNLNSIYRNYGAFAKISQIAIFPEGREVLRESAAGFPKLLTKIFDIYDQGPVSRSSR